MKKDRISILVWELPNRAFHWLLALVAVVGMFWGGTFSLPGMRDNPGLVAALAQPASGGEEDD
jgi:hypothetical protein